MFRLPVIGKAVIAVIALAPATASANQAIYGRVDAELCGPPIHGRGDTPIEGARVTARRQGDDDVEASDRSDSHGRFRLLLEPGRYVVAVRPRGSRKSRAYRVRLRRNHSVRLHVHYEASP